MPKTIEVAGLTFLPVVQVRRNRRILGLIPREIARAVVTRRSATLLGYPSGTYVLQTKPLSVALSSLSGPRATILNASSAKGRCNASASSHGARIQPSRSSSVVMITGIALGWIGSTTAFPNGRTSDYARLL